MADHGSNGDESRANLKRYHELSWYARAGRFFLPGRVSRIHLYEAQERYVYLTRMVQLRRALLQEEGAAAPEAEMEEQDAAREAEERKNAGRRRREATEALEICEEILSSAGALLTRRQKDLNFLWREMTLVHLMLLSQVIRTQDLPNQLDFCREEARRLGCSEDPEIKELMSRAADVINPTEDQRAEKVRHLRALVERFTTIRTGRIHEQFVNIRAFIVSLIILLPIAVILIANAPLVLDLKKAPEFPPLPDLSRTFDDPAQFFGARPFFWYCLAAVAQYMRANVLAFVFFAGITGGFFSVALRRQGRLVPGADAYFMWYVLSKPFVGALGAVILFILVQTGLVAEGALQGQLLVDHPNAGVFAFAFLSGFSERMIFPSLTASSNGTGS